MISGSSWNSVASMPDHREAVKEKNNDETDIPQAFRTGDLGIQKKTSDSVGVSSFS